MKDPVPEYGEVPPVAETVHWNDLPAVSPEVGHETVTSMGCGAIATVAEPEAETWFESVTLNVSWKLPLTG